VHCHRILRADPIELYVAVAEVLAFVMRQTAKFSATWMGTHTIDD
jgi:type III secretion system FlhB-like substrate exporter